MSFREEILAADPTLDVREVGVSLPALVALGERKGMFDTAFWGKLRLPEGSVTQQMERFLQLTMPDWSKGAVCFHEGGKCGRVLRRDSAERSYSVLSVGDYPAKPQLLGIYRALWDIGIRQHYGIIDSQKPNAVAFRAQVAAPGITSTVEANPRNPQEDIVTLYFPERP